MKKIISITLALVLVLGCFAACSNTKTEDPANTDASTPNETAGTDAIKIGGIGPVTGPAAVYGIATRNGAQIAVDEINALGDLKLELNFQDDEGDAEKSVNAYNTLKDWGMQLLYGCTTTTPCIAVAAESNSNHYFQLTPSASSADVTAGKDNVFQICFSDPNQGKTAAQYIADNELATKIAVIYNNGDAYSTGVYTAFAAEAENLGFEIVSTTTFPGDDTTDFSVQLGDAKANGAELVFMPIYYTPASLILAQANNMNFAPIFFGCDGMDGILGLEGFDASLAEGLMLLTPFNASSADEATAKFVEDYEAKYGETPNQFAADGYDCIYAIYEACKKSGITPESSSEEVCDALIATFTSSDFVMNGVTGEDMTWSTSGEVSKPPKVVVIKDGVYEGM